MKVVDRVVDVVRRSAPTAARTSRSDLNNAVLCERYESARDAAKEALSAAESVEAMAEQQCALLDTATDEARLLDARGKDLRAASDQVREALERTRLIALNAGLEGARLGEAPGKALVAVGDEVRAVIARAVEALDEQLSLLTQSERERARLREQVEHARRGAGELAEGLPRCTAAQRDAQAALGKLTEDLRRLVGTDRELERAVASAASHARGLLLALSALSSQSRRSMVLRALQPSIRPLLRLLQEVDETDDRQDPQT